MGYHDEIIKQYRRHINMDDVTYQKTIDGVFDCILKTNPNISLIEVSYLCEALKDEVSSMLVKEQEQARKTPLASLKTR